ncbi:MAG: hypothetical protein FJZ58_08520, partial [Chlamydiae bacterium]|nr:hypothetical protein [Chlamydiota bacterium]
DIAAKHRIEGHEEGRKEGREEGRKEGRKENSQEVALKLLKNGISLTIISQATNLSKQEVLSLLETLPEEIRKSYT